MNFWPFNRKAKLALPMVFGIQSNTYPEAGSFVADHRSEGKQDAIVRFSFVGLSGVPHLTPEIYAYIVEQAGLKGYVFKQLRGYATMVAVPRPQLPPTMPTAEARAKAREEAAALARRPAEGINPQTKAVFPPKNESDNERFDRQFNSAKTV